ncbi:hypothetical protein GCM10023169_35260 [Georgenia halophila]|uniref:Iron(III) transport system substrate-binding protein n=1 Tax=Georgenia halophila TaxID=620889 RepID=A0ABP8LLF5_9MICO
MTGKTRRRPLLAVVLGGSLTLAACGSGGASDEGGGGGGGDAVQADTLDALVAAAEEEGQLVWYQTADARIAQDLADAFMEQYDIEASFSRLNSSQMEQRFSAEADAGSPAADVILPIHSEFFNEAMSQDWLVPLEEANIPDFPADHMPEEALLEDSGTAVIGITQYAFGYNSEMVDSGEAPETWEDLLDPRWDGEILMSDPTISSVYTNLYYLVEQEYGLDFLRQLGEEEPRIYQGAAPMGEALAAGEGSLAVPLPIEYMENLRDEGGAPLAWSMMDVSVGAASVVGVVADSPNPNAARLFAHWLMTEEALELFTASEGTVNPVDTDQYPTELSGPALREQSSQREDEIYEALGF